MTVIVGAKFSEGIVLISDSRATITHANDTFPSDNLQKIVGLDENHIVAYATNNLNCIETVLTEYQYFLKNSPSANTTEHLGKFSGFCVMTYGMYKDSFVFLMAIEEGSNWKLYQFETPDFVPTEIEDISIKGSGSFIDGVLTQYYEDSIPEKISMRRKADSLVRAMMTSLNGPNSSTIGGLPQALVLTSKGVQTVHTGYIDFSPEGEPDSKQISYKNGNWVQQDDAKGSELAVIPLNQISNSNLSKQVFYNYERVSKKEIKWYLNSFDLYRSLAVDHMKTTLGFRLGSLLVLEFPQTVEAVLYVSAFGPSTEHDIEVTLENPAKQSQVLYSDHFDNTKFPHEIEFIENCKFTVHRRGKHYLVCKINGIEIGRKVIYAYEPRSTKPIAEVQEDMTSFLNGYSDSTVKPHLSLVTLSGKDPVIAEDKSSVVIDDQFSQIYYNRYPVNVDFYLYVTIQANPGDFEISIDFINATDKSVLFSGSVMNASTSVTNTVPNVFKMSPAINSKGFYFFRIYIDGRMIGAMPFFADSYPAMTFDLTDEDGTHVKAGGILKFAKRPVEKQETNA